MNRLALALALTCLLGAAGQAASPNPATLAVPPGELTRARELVGRLGSELFGDREDAQEDLARMGRLALPALLDGLNSNPNPEVRFRCRALLPKAAVADLQARLATFLADADGKFDHDLPGWTEFRKTAGAGAAARATFVRLIGDADNRALVFAVGGPAGDLGRLVAARRQEVYQWRFPRTPAATRKDATADDVAAVLFAESHVASNLVPRSVNTTVLFSTPGFSAALADAGEKGRVYRAVAAHWFVTRDDAATMYQAVSQAENLGMKAEAAGVAARLVRLKAAPATYQANAAMALARLSAREYLPALEAAFGNEVVVSRTARVLPGGGTEQTETQMRDVALAAALLLTGQDPADYGFRTPRPTAGLRLTYTSWQIADKQRADAFDKWKAWRAQHRDFESGKNEKQ